MSATSSGPVDGTPWASRSGAVVDRPWGAWGRGVELVRVAAGRAGAGAVVVCA
ncbi:MAG TPA: hypothetical protein VGV12_03935 [Gemmatimonadales bacterium]|nr:hypothetical protein [Gemmatimonadales bacterium]